MQELLLLHLLLAPTFASSLIRLGPVDAVLSSVYGGYAAEKCIDGEEGGWDPGSSDEENMCHTLPEPLPWLALDFGRPVNVMKVLLVNRLAEGWDLARGIQVRVADELPTSSEELFTGGSLLGTYEGPGRENQKITIKKGTAQMLLGRYLVVQMDNGDEAPLHLKEVSALGFGGAVVSLFEFISKNCEIVFNNISVPDQQLLEEDCNATCRGENFTQSGTRGGWEEQTDKCYLWSNEKKNWTEAEMACR